MREIKFRGKTLSDEWIEGLLLVEKSLNYYNDELETRHFIVDESQRDWSHDRDCLTSFGEEVIPKTTGQYTSRKDINDKKIYEGDIIDGYLINPRVPTRGVITYDEEHLFWGSKNLAGITALFKIKDIKVIGNIYDNPELLGDD